jgi:hypothetical protein
MSWAISKVRVLTSMTSSNLEVLLPGGVMAVTTFDERRAILKAESQRLEDYLHTLTPEA